MTNQMSLCDHAADKDEIEVRGPRKPMNASEEGAVSGLKRRSFGINLRGVERETR